MWHFLHLHYFMALSHRLIPWLSFLCIIFLSVGLYLSLFLTPPDYQQGDLVKIMFIHVPFAWLGLAFYTAMAFSAFIRLVWQNPLADVFQKAAAPLGATFTFLCLLTGAIWGKPTWGTWWVWDARLTSMFILFLMYLGLIVVWQTMEDPSQASKSASILTLVGAINLPIIKFSVNWWNTLHQPASVLRSGAPTLHPSFLFPLIYMAFSIFLLAFTLQLVSMRTEILRRRLRRYRLLIAQKGEIKG